ncbi:MAG: hypothetical protein WD757_03180 [Actinomycetota bacterium]
MALRYSVRRFLNLAGHNGGAYVLAYVENTSGSTDPDDHAYSRLEIADCSERISLYFCLDEARDRRNSVRKARMLADVLDQFARAIEEEAALSANRRSRR